jgi:hypothetical protein
MTPVVVVVPHRHFDWSFPIIPNPQMNAAFPPPTNLPFPRFNSNFNPQHQQLTNQSVWLRLNSNTLPEDRLISSISLLLLIDCPHPFPPISNPNICIVGRKTKKRRGMDFPFDPNPVSKTSSKIPPNI